MLGQCWPIGGSARAWSPTRFRPIGRAGTRRVWGASAKTSVPIAARVPTQVTLEALSHHRGLGAWPAFPAMPLCLLLFGHNRGGVGAVPGDAPVAGIPGRGANGESGAEVGHVAGTGAPESGQVAMM